MPRLSVLTAVGGASARFLATTAASLHPKTQPLPHGWDLEWCLGIDGPDAIPDKVLDAALAAGPSVIHCERLSRSYGEVTARTAALTTATGDFIYVLDSDDVVPDLCLSDLIYSIVAHPESRWVAGHGWLVTDARHAVLEGRAASIPEGHVAQGELSRFYHEQGRCPFPPATILARTEDVFAVGGWPALPANADCAMLLGLDKLGPGYLVPGLHLIVRRHSGQVSGDAQWDIAKRWIARAR